MVPICTRTGQVIEPMLTDQWFRRHEQGGPGRRHRQIHRAKKALTPWPAARCKFVPENWVNTYNQWMNNIQDWCISRQLWWGHQIPAWYDEDGNVSWRQRKSKAKAQAQAAAKTC